MTMDKSLRVRKGSAGSRGVLTRVERIAKLEELGTWQEGQRPLGLPKVRVYKVVLKNKKTKKEEPAAETGGKKKK